MRSSLFILSVCFLSTNHLLVICNAQDEASLDRLRQQHEAVRIAITNDNQARSKALSELANAIATHNTLDKRLRESQAKLDDIQEQITETEKQIAEDKRNRAEDKRNRARARLKQPWNAAGVIPYAVAENQVFVLLGSENRDKALRWTSFVGGKKSLESPIDTAAQEFWEETRHAYSRESIHASIDPEMMIYNATEKAFSFIIQVPYVSEHRLNVLHDVPDDEKEKYFWVPLDDLLKAVDAATDKFQVTFTYIRLGDDDENPESESVSVHLYHLTYSDLKTNDAKRVFEQVRKAAAQ